MTYHLSVATMVTGVILMGYGQFVLPFETEQARVVFGFGLGLFLGAVPAVTGERNG